MAINPNYSVKFINNSINKGDVCIYQTNPNIVGDTMSLAWLTKTAHPTTKVKFSWEIDYSFVWSETGVLAPGAIFEASQTFDTDLRCNNKIHFCHDDGAFTFKDVSDGSNGEFMITLDKNVPLNIASVGIAMSGKGVFARLAQPNMTYIFDPHPRYWITFGNFEHGEVLDITRITNKAELYFPPNVFEITAVLNRDNTWTIGY